MITHIGLHNKTEKRKKDKNLEKKKMQFESKETISKNSKVERKHTKLRKKM